MHHVAAKQSCDIFVYILVYNTIVTDRINSFHQMKISVTKPVKWEIGYLMRTMQSFRAASFKLQLSKVSDVANELDIFSFFDWLTRPIRGSSL